jgi:cysteinyl-tRNA synthetase
MPFDADKLNLKQSSARIMASDCLKQSPWVPPQHRPNAQLPRLKIYNSLTRSKDDFVPLHLAKKIVTWYSRSLTVYENAYLGYPRNYILTNIIYHIVKDYFGFYIKFVINMININNKIIFKGC